jgi:serine/threonine protein phosphatase PrpC
MNWGSRCSGASVRGQSHFQSGTPCQDAHGWVQFDDTIVLACADGAGSAARAEEGSSLAVESALTFLTRSVLWRRWAESRDRGLSNYADILRETFAHARRTLHDYAKASDIPLEQLATTLLVAMVGPDFTAAGQVGDGAIVSARGEETEIVGLTKPYQGMFVNEAVFITQETYEEHLQISVGDSPASHVALFTDGVEPVAVKYATGEPSTNLFRGLFEFIDNTPSEALRLRALNDLLSGDRLAERSDDDKTLLLASYSRDTDKEQSLCA